MAEKSVKPDSINEQSNAIVPTNDNFSNVMKIRICGLFFAAINLIGCSQFDTAQWDLMGHRDADQFNKAELDDLSEKAREIRAGIVETQDEYRRDKEREREREKRLEVDPELEKIRLLAAILDNSEDEQVKRLAIEKMFPKSSTPDSELARTNEHFTNNEASQHGNRLAGSRTLNEAADMKKNNAQRPANAYERGKIRGADMNSFGADQPVHNLDKGQTRDTTFNQSMTQKNNNLGANSSNTARIVASQPVIVDSNVAPASGLTQDFGNLVNATGSAAVNRNQRLPNPHNELDIEHMPIQLGDWKRKLLETVSLLEQTKTQKNLTATEEAYLDISLRFLNLIQGNHDEAVKAIEGMSIEEQEYWKEQLFAMSRFIIDPTDDSTGVFVSRQKQAFRTLVHLRNATSHLASIATLDVKHLHWCTRIDDFGQYTEVTNKTFTPGSNQLVYCEIENWAIEETATSKGARFVSKIQPSFVILNSDLEVVKQHQYGMLVDESRNQRRDFHLTLPIQIPKLPSGTYHLQLTIDDAVGNKAATSKIPLTFRVQ